MVKYICKQCNFTTSNKTGYSRHCNTKKHLKNVQEVPVIPENTQVENRSETGHKKFICEYCGNTYSRNCTLTKHLKTCIVMKNKDYEIRLKYLEKMNDVYKREAENYKNMFDQFSTMSQKSVSSITYIMNNYGDAPAIKPFNISCIETDDDQFIEAVFHEYNNNRLHKYIGDMLITYYKKADPSKQSIWNTDTSRLTYILKKYIHEKKSEWHVDKKGIETMSFIITPIINSLKTMAMEYHSRKCLKTDITNLTEVQLITEIFAKLINDINTEKLHDNILKYISSFLKISDKPLMIKD